VLTESNDRSQPARLDYAIVIDAKYTSRINPRHQDGVRKYNEIRSTNDDRPVVRQVWLAYPSDSNIAPWDDAVEWTELGANRPQNENINGTLGIIPPSSPAAEGSDSTVNETILEFAKGTLAYLGMWELRRPDIQSRQGSGRRFLYLAALESPPRVPPNSTIIGFLRVQVLVFAMRGGYKPFGC
jgi:hypothetical protein